MQDFHLFYYLFEFLWESVWHSSFYTCSKPSLSSLWSMYVYIRSGSSSQPKSKMVCAMSMKISRSHFLMLWKALPVYFLQFQIRTPSKEYLMYTDIRLMGLPHHLSPLDPLYLLILTAGAVMNFLTLLFIFFSKEVVSALKLWTSDFKFAFSRRNSLIYEE